MKRISEEVWKTLPRKPLAIYLKFRKEKLVEFEGLDSKFERIKKEWKELSKDIKDGMARQYQSDLQTFNEEIRKWKELHGATEAEIMDRLKR
jgi:archaellum component FlaC